MEADGLRERKLEKLEKLTKRYSQNKGLLHQLFATRYYNTSEADPSRTSAVGMKAREIRFSAGSALIQAAFIFFVQIIMFFSADSVNRKHPVFIFFQALFTLVVIYLLYVYFRKPVALKIDSDGIEDVTSNRVYFWDDILATHTYISSPGVASARTYLVIDFYDSRDDGFKSHEIDITDLDANSETISGYIESYKRLRMKSE